MAVPRTTGGPTGQRAAGPPRPRRRTPSGQRRPCVDDLLLREPPVALDVLDVQLTPEALLRARRHAARLRLVLCEDVDSPRRRIAFAHGANRHSDRNMIFPHIAPATQRRSLMA